MGRSILLLHSHLPLVRHPEHEQFLEERWLFEAISETYLPLVRMMSRLDKESIPFPMAMSFSPTLSFMLQDELLMERYIRYLDRNIELAEKELDRTSGDPRFAPLSEYYFRRYTTDRAEIRDEYGGNLVKSFAFYAKKGQLELLASAATHAFLPNYRNYPELIRLQIELGIETHISDFGCPPRGFWLPECGYYEGLDSFLKSAGIRYFVGAAHGVLFGEPTPRSGTYRPLETPAGITVFPRDVYTAAWVWSSEHGYPAHSAYRDFYRDIGHDLPLDYVRPYIHDEAIRIDTGFKYHAITGKEDDKDPYDLTVGKRTAAEHAADYFERQREHTRRIDEVLGAQSVITSPFDTELFGHWWFEGPIWLEELFRIAHRESHTDTGYAMTTPSRYLEDFGRGSTVSPTFSSWGSHGYAEVWLDGSNDWIYRHTHNAIERMGELVARFPDQEGLKRRALNQAAREVLLAMASDWPFILNAQTVVPYANRRVKEHLANFTRVYDELSQRSMGTGWLTVLEKKHPLFPELDYRRMRLAASETLRSLLP